ncbi:MAG: hypothetical protein WAX89_07100 [Alphaproteobacteria bacterium]
MQTMTVYACPVQVQATGVVKVVVFTPKGHWAMGETAAQALVGFHLVLSETPKAEWRELVHVLTRVVKRIGRMTQLPPDVWHQPHFLPAVKAMH